MKNIFLPIFIILVSNFSYGAEEFNFDDVRLRGTGCPEGSYQVINTPDHKTTSIMFSEFNAELPKVSEDDEPYNENVSHKECKIIILAHLPAGHKVDGINISVQFRGAVMLGPGIKGQVNSNLISWEGPRGRQGRTVRRLGHLEWNNRTNQTIDRDWAIDKQTFVNTNQSQCSERNRKKVKVVFKNKIFAKVKNNWGDLFAFVGLDSADFSSEMKVSFRVSKCNTRTVGRNDPGRGNHYGHGHRNGRRPPRHSRYHRRNAPSVNNHSRARPCYRYRNGRRIAIRCPF